MNWWQKDVSTPLGILIILAAAVIIFGGVFAYEHYSSDIPSPLPPSSPAPDLIYKNTQYGFQLTLLNSWKGYSVIQQTWEGHAIDNYQKTYSGPLILIRNPKWSQNAPWQDIPVMVFTPDVWEMVKGPNATVAVSAAPIGPSRLGENKNYVFALPPRWIGFTDNLGQGEAQEIIKTFRIIKN